MTSLPPTRPFPRKKDSILKLRTTVALAAAASLALAGPAHAATTVVAKGLDNPRGLALAPDGTLYIAQAGKAGKTCINKDTCFGFTSKISALAADGTLSDLAADLISGAGPDGSFATGIDDVSVGPDGSVYGIETAAPPKTKGLPAAARKQLAHVIKARAGKGVPVGARVDTIEIKSNPDKTDVNSNPYSVAIGPDGTKYVADAGGNTILKVTNTKVSLVAVIPKLGKAQAVPTSMRFGPDGALYIGVLGGGGVATNGSKVFRLVPGQKPTVYATGFRNISGIAFDKAGNLYVSELYRTGSEQSGPKPDGDVVKIAADSTRSVAGKVPFPAGVAVADDGTIYVSAYSIVPGTTPKASPFKGAGGQVVKITP
jgi:glucose/arabinose dehydrogenase